jgi:5'(3')-deoxyribonucleotidase
MFEIDLFIDDAPMNIEDVVMTGTKCIIFDRPWNDGYKQPKNVTRVHDWKEIVRIIENM